MSHRLTKITGKKNWKSNSISPKFKKKGNANEKVSEEPHHVMGGLGWAGVGWGWDGVGLGGSGMGWGGVKQYWISPRVLKKEDGKQ